MAFRIERSSLTFVDSRLLYEQNREEKNIRARETRFRRSRFIFRPSTSSDNFSPVGVWSEKKARSFEIPGEKVEPFRHLVIFCCFSWYVSFTCSLLVRQRFAQLQVRETSEAAPRSSHVNIFSSEAFCLYLSREERERERKRKKYKTEPWLYARRIQAFHLFDQRNDRRNECFLGLRNSLPGKKGENVNLPRSSAAFHMHNFVIFFLNRTAVFSSTNI